MLTLAMCSNEGCQWCVCGFRTWCVLLLCLVSGCVAAPASVGVRYKRDIISDSVQNYLMNYGYLPQSDRETGNLRTEEQLRSAIRTLQRYGNLQETGEVDDQTLFLMRRPRCGLPDVLPSTNRSRRYAIQGNKWDKTDLTWSLVHPSASLSVGRTKSELHRAFQVWSAETKLTFAEVQGENADILIGFFQDYHEDGYPFDGQGSVLAHAFFPGSGRGGDTHFDLAEDWLENDDDRHSGVSLYAVAAHEFGHALGLSHSSKDNALMYPWYKGLKPNFKLPDDDRFGIQQLYGKKHGGKEWATIPPYVPPRTPRPPPRTTPASRPDPPRRGEATPRPQPEVPDMCETSYDAISIIRGELFIFKGKFFWRFDKYGRLLPPGHPTKIDRFWQELPRNLSHVDAVYERRQDGKIVFFIDAQYWLFDGNRLAHGYPRPITDLGLPANLKKVDGAMVWGHNGRTYFFSGTMYWRYDEEARYVELDYPRDMSMWRGVPYHIDSVFQYKDGNTYFFKGRVYWQFDDRRMRVSSRTASLSAPKWFVCARPGASLPSNPGLVSGGAHLPSAPRPIHMFVFSFILCFWFRNILKL